MSERPSDQSPSGKSTKHNDSQALDERTRSPTTNITSSQPILGSYGPIPSDAQQRTVHTGRHFELPPLAPVQGTTERTFSTSTPRIAGVSSILNPIQQEDTHASRRRKASHLESPASSNQSLPPIIPGPQIPPSLSARPQSPPSQYGAPIDRPPRRVLTPKSPSLHRAASLGQLNPSTGNLSALTHPFPSSPRGRAYAIEPGTSGAPPLPTPPAGARPTYGFPAPAPPVDVGRRASVATTRQRQLSESAGSNSSYSSYSQAEQTSPAMPYDSMVPESTSARYESEYEAAFSGSGTASAPPSTLPPERQRQMGIPISSSGGQSVYQMFTLETTSGTVHLPVDVQAASRVADEKRRRNAGASARFRQRRKEKEKEASTTIGRLEQQMKEINEDMVHYRNERDYFRSVVSHMPGGERHYNRPPSPRHRRGSSMRGRSGPESSGYMQQRPRSPGESRNVRRRTSTLSLPPPPQQLTMPPPGVPAHPTYGSYPPQSMPATLPSASGPLPRASQLGGGPSAQHPHGPPPVLQALPQTGPYNPYASERRPSGPPQHPQERQ